MKAVDSWRYTVYVYCAVAVVDITDHRPEVYLGLFHLTMILVVQGVT